MYPVLPEDISVICREAAAKMRKHGAFTPYTLSVDRRERSANVFSDVAVTRDGLGWILKVSYGYFAGKTPNRKFVGNQVAEYIDSQIRINTHDAERLMSVSDQGAEATAQALERVAESIGNQLPKLFAYAKSSEGPEKPLRVFEHHEA